MKKINLKNKKVLVTGAAGFLGQALVDKLLKEGITQLIAYDKDEYRMSEMARIKTNKIISYWLGDICNLRRLEEACEDIDIIFHVAALKRMENTAHNAYEVINVNVNGTRNVVLAGKKCEKIIFVSSDKAYHAENAYGSSKFLAEQMILAEKNGFCWRFGNFKWSTGSVWEIFAEQRDNNIPLTITDPNATRFVIDIDEVCNYILSEIKSGKIYYPKMESMTIKEIAFSVAPGREYKIIGLRTGEKLHEELEDDYTSDKNLNK